MSIPQDIVLLILINAKTPVISAAWRANKALFTILTRENFWQEKLKLEGLPKMTYGDTTLCDIGEYLVIPNQSAPFWSALYKLMVDAYYDARGIMDIIRIYTYNNTCKESITIFVDDYTPTDVESLIPIKIDAKLYRPHIIVITKANKTSPNDGRYKLKYTLIDKIERGMKTITTIVDTNSVLLTLTSFLFRKYTGDEHINIEYLTRNRLTEPILRAECDALISGMWMMYDSYC
jgi:hypothetical protein